MFVLKHEQTRNVAGLWVGVMFLTSLNVNVVGMLTKHSIIMPPVSSSRTWQDDRLLSRVSIHTVNMLGPLWVSIAFGLLYTLLGRILIRTGSWCHKWASAQTHSTLLPWPAATLDLLRLSRSSSCTIPLSFISLI